MEIRDLHSTTRFSDRVENYVKYRPHYPVEVVRLLTQTCGLTAGHIMADIGAGTGILTRLFLDHGNTVFAVEPNQAMRQSAEATLAGFPNFSSCPGTAEETGLPASSVDFIVAAQAFHWFDRVRAKSEFLRILRPGGWVVLIWNERRINTSPFLQAYEALLKKHATDYHWVNPTHLSPDIIADFFSPAPLYQTTFKNSQSFDLAGLIGRALSSSYVPNEGQPGYLEVVAGLEQLFESYQQKGRVEFEYLTNLYYGQFGC